MQKGGASKIATFVQETIFSLDLVIDTTVSGYRSVINNGVTPFNTISLVYKNEST